MGGCMSGTSPTDHGYAWVAEWEKHEATWISWPHNELTWPGRFHTIPSVTEELVRTISQVETVHVLGGPKIGRAHV